MLVCGSLSQDVQLQAAALELDVSAAAFFGVFSGISAQTQCTRDIFCFPLRLFEMKLNAITHTHTQPYLKITGVHRWRRRERTRGWWETGWLFGRWRRGWVVHWDRHTQTQTRRHRHTHADTHRQLHKYFPFFPTFQTITILKSRRHWIKLQETHLYSYSW